MTAKHFTLLLAVVGCFFLNNLNAQNLTFEDVTEIRLQDMGPIYQSGIVKGYFAFYFIDKAEEKNMARFKLLLLDENLNKIGEKSLLEHKDLSLEMASYDGVSLLFIFHEDSKKETLEFRRYDLQLNLLSNESRILGAIENYFIDAPYDGIQQIPPHIVSIDGKGFIFYNFDGNGAVRYKMQYFPEKGQGWKRASGPKDRDDLLPAALCHSDKILLQNFTEWSTPSKYLQAISLETGKVLFDKELILEKYAIQVFHAYPDSAGNFVVAGQYYDREDNILKSRSLGVFVGKINPEGGFIAHKYLSWEKDIAQKIKIDEEGKIGGQGFMFFRDAVHTKDGKLYLAGELYDLANVRLRRGVDIQDFAIFEINADMTLNEIKIVEKPDRFYDFSKNGGIPMTRNPEKLANFVRLHGGFDYEYTQVGDDENAFTFFYSTREEKDKKTIRKLAAVSKHVGDTNYETDQITLNPDTYYHKVLPAKSGHLLFIDYFKEKKQLDMRIEKFNY